MNKPQRIQLSRRAGFDLQKLSRELNGLQCVVVSRPSKWGNPWRVKIDGTAMRCVERHRNWINSNHQLQFPTKKDIQNELRGKNLACWCGINDPCHGDTLLQIANE